MSDLTGKTDQFFQLPVGWRFFVRVSSDFFILSRIGLGGTRFAPLCVHSFRLIVPSRPLDAQRLQRQYQTYDQVKTVPDRLRWHRHRLGLMQKEVAAKVGIPTPLYLDMENGACLHYPAPVMDKLASLYQVPVDDLLDDYNRFLYSGQTQQLLAMRQKLGLSRPKFAAKTGISVSSIRSWETGQKLVSRKCWEKYFKDWKDIK